MASSSSSSRASLEGRSKFDVFISFRGDTRNNFTSHLYDALRREQIQTFIDDTEIKRAEEISSSLTKAIQGCKISVVVFSPQYASSKWRLEELAEIIECQRTNRQIVIPVFYHVDPSHVRNPTGSFADAFAKHERQVALQGKLQKWKDALKEAANLSGWDSSVTRSEANLIKDIVGDILKKLNQMSEQQVHSINLVGIESHIKNVESLLFLKSPKVQSVGIWGMGGMGKTTLARVVFYRICSQFEGVHFAENVKVDVGRDGIAPLWSKLLLKLLGEDTPYMGTLSLDPTFLKERLLQKKVFIVFDDVDDSILEQLKELLIGKDNLFGIGSKILVTSRDKQVLKNLVDEVYKVVGLKHEEALQLFSLSAFKKEFPPNDYIKMSNKVADYASGNPLAIKVFGSALLDKNKDEWDSALDKLEEVPKPGIMSVLRISYDGLSNIEKKIFLDISFFFKGEDRDRVTNILDNCYSCVCFIIGNLIDKSLITISHKNKLDIHDLLQEMSLNIVRQKSTTNPAKHSRLCNVKDVYNVLTQKKGTKEIEGICLDLSISREMNLEVDAFTGMNGLRFLKFYNGRRNEEKVHLPRGLKYLPEELIYLHWDGFPSKSLPPKFCVDNLVQLILSDSKLKQLWVGEQNLVNLNSLNLSGSSHSRKIPNLSKAKNIKEISLWRCESLVTLPSSIQYLEKLEYLNTSNCTNLRSHPRKIHSKFLKVLRLHNCQHVRECPEIISENLKELCLNGTAIKEVPKPIFDKLKNLSHLCLHDSDMTKIPELARDMKFLCLNGSGIEEVPSSIEFLTKLKDLRFIDSKKLLRLPSTLCKLKSLEALTIMSSPKLESFPEILEPMESLDVLILRNCNIQEICGDMICRLSSLTQLSLRENNFKSLPANMKQLRKLEGLYLDHCKQLRSLPELPSSLRILTAVDCEALETFPSLRTHASFRKLELRNCLKLDQNVPHEIKNSSEYFHHTFKHLKSLILPGSEIPKWFSRQIMGSSLTIQLTGNAHRVSKIYFCAIIASGKFLSPRTEKFTFGYHLKTYNGRYHDAQLETFFSLNKHDLLKSDHLLLWSSEDYKLLDFASNGELPLSSI